MITIMKYHNYTQMKILQTADVCILIRLSLNQIIEDFIGYVLREKWAPSYLDLNYIKDDKNRQVPLKVTTVKTFSIKTTVMPLKVIKFEGHKSRS